MTFYDRRSTIDDRYCRDMITRKKKERKKGTKEQTKEKETPPQKKKKDNLIKIYDRNDKSNEIVRLY